MPFSVVMVNRILYFAVFVCTASSALLISRFFQLSININKSVTKSILMLLTCVGIGDDDYHFVNWYVLSNSYTREKTFCYTFQILTLPFRAAIGPLFYDLRTYCVAVGTLFFPSDHCLWVKLLCLSCSHHIHLSVLPLPPFLSTYCSSYAIPCYTNSYALLVTLYCY